MKVRIILDRNQLFDGNHWILTLMKTLLIKPEEIANLTNLTGLNLSSNQLSGKIPKSICDIYPNLSLANSIFSVSDNQLCPPYPDCIKYTVGVQDISGCG